MELSYNFNRIDFVRKLSSCVEVRVDEEGLRKLLREYQVPFRTRGFLYKEMEELKDAILQKSEEQYLPPSLIAASMRSFHAHCELTALKQDSLILRKCFPFLEEE